MGWGTGCDRPTVRLRAGVKTAAESSGKRIFRVFCIEHHGEVGEIRYTPYGRLFVADVPTPGAGEWLRRLRKETGERPPPLTTEVRYLIDRGDEAEDPAQAWCEPGQHRMVLSRLDFTSHSASIRVKR